MIWVSGMKTSEEISALKSDMEKASLIPEGVLGTPAREKKDEKGRKEERSIWLSTTWKNFDAWFLSGNLSYE